MALPIIERPIYGQILLETGAWSGSAYVWTDQTAKIVSGIDYSQGGRVGTPGSSPVDAGTLNVSLKNLGTIPVVGELVRLRRTAASNYMFTGYIQDVSQRVVYDNTVSINNPIIITTLNCVDWVAYVSQFQAVGAGGYNSSGSLLTGSDYDWENRVNALNRIIDSSGATALIQELTNADAYNLGDTDMVGSISEHLDLMVRTNPGSFWYATTNLPTNKTTGRTSLVRVDDSTTTEASGKTFTDLAGSAGQLHYTEIDFENSSQNIANVVVVNNSSRLHVDDLEVTKIGGFNEQNYVVVNNSNVVGIKNETTYTKTSSSSITNYGVRQTEFETNSTVSTNAVFNLIVNPSIEYSDDGYTRGNVNSIVRRRKPIDDLNPFSAYTGKWAMRSRQIVASTNARILFSGGEADGIPVIGGIPYYWKGYGARGTTSRTDMRALLRVNWYDDAETLLSTTTPATTTLTTANTWYLVSGSGTAPAFAARATIEMLFERSGGGNLTVGDRVWADAWMLSKSNDAYMDGDFPTDASNIYGWCGGVGSSPSFKTTNYVDQLAAQFINIYSTTSIRAKKIRWNAQEDLASLSSLTVGKTISLIYSGTTTTYRIVGIDGTVDPDRYMIDYYLVKV
jgi:hypothetical protein